MLERNEHGVLTFDGDAFLAALDEGLAELKRADELLGHVTELAYPMDLAEYKEMFPGSAPRMDWEFALRVRKRHDGTWRIFGRSEVAWNRQPHWAPSWGGVEFPTLDEALAELPTAMAAHSEACREELRAVADRFAQRQAESSPHEPEGDPHGNG